VSQLQTGFSVTYRKDGDSPMLYALDGIDRSGEPLKVKFWARAWTAAHQKAQAIGWLNS